jgi:SAM-dependent methyltransferase
VIKINKFLTFFSRPYEEMESVISKYLSDGQQIMDIGSNDGAIAGMVDKYHTGCIVHCVDIDTNALEKLGKRKFQNTAIRGYNQDANQFLAEDNLSRLDAVVINAALHEINTPYNQQSYLYSFFDQCRKKLRPEGRLIIGDYYYPDHVSDEEVQAYMAHQLAEIGHADPRNKFINPCMLAQIAENSELYPVFFSENPAVKGIDRRYYIFVMEV